MGARSYGSVKKRKRWHMDRIPRIRSCLFVFLALLLYFESILLPAMLFSLDSIQAVVLGNLITSAVLIWLYRTYKCGIRPHEKTVTRRQYGFWVGIFMVTSISLEFLFHFVDSHVTDPGMDDRSAAIEGSILLFLFLSLLIAPLTEEIMLRLFCYNVLCSGFSHFTAMLVSSLLFAALHGTVAHMVAATILGCILALSYEATGKWFVPVIGHYLYNTIVLFGFNETLLKLTDSSVFMVFNLAVISVILFLAGWQSGITKRKE